MKQATRFSVQNGWKLLMRDMGLDVVEVLARAQLPEDLFLRRDASLTPAEYFRLWGALEDTVGGEGFPLLLAKVLSAEAFAPPIFASLCSPDLNTALCRLAHYKRLVGPLAMSVEIGPRQTVVSLDCYGHAGPLPRSLGTSELVVFTLLARMGTRRHVVPTALGTPSPPTVQAPFEAFFGVPLGKAKETRIAFSAEDAASPFLTDNPALWESFEPDLRRRLAALDKAARTSERVRGALLEMLPAGLGSIEEVASRLAMSKRSLQRHLQEEAVAFTDLLNEVRQALAEHYLLNTAISQGEISWLLGFQESNSFLRAFRHWTGTTPGAFRAGHATPVAGTH